MNAKTELMRLTSLLNQKYEKSGLNEFESRWFAIATFAIQKCTKDQQEEALSMFETIQNYTDVK